MKTFGELLSEYIKQSGVSDAELARRLGISRQTVFRWREGLTQRPRHREDVLRMAEMLRLSPAERDQLLQAGGFPPDQERHPGGELAEGVQAAESGEEKTGGRGVSGAPAPPRTSGGRIWQGLRQRWRIAVLGLVVVLAIAVGSLTGFWAQLAANLGLAQSQPAGPGETLVLISPFVNYSGGQAGFNVAGRLKEVLDLEFLQAGLEAVRVEVPSTGVQDEAAALELVDQLKAVLVVWGEYDSGRVIAVVTRVDAEAAAESQQRRWLISSPGELSTTINSELPDEVRWLALYILGQSHFQAGRQAEAEAAFNRALATPPGDPATQAAVYYYLALLESKAGAPDQSTVVALYSEALELRPEFASALNNRAVAYINREAPGDMDRAETDLRTALSRAPEDPTLLFNLALTVARQGPDRLEEALGLLERAQEHKPESPGIQNGLCWFYSVAGNPQQALPHCDQAVQLDESGLSNDSRGLALALLGRTEEAISEFEAFLVKLQEQDPEAYQRFAPSRRSWIEALRSGQNPFDASTLSSLLAE
jgi:tetratricopeptide (TPR) repeat protein/transcriptional regulator with XRE-family HTH domain